MFLLHDKTLSFLLFTALQMIVFIVVACLLALSYVLNIWFIYYVCCKQRRRRKRHLTAVQQRAITRRKGSQEGLDNVALDSEGCVDMSTNVKRESPKLREMVSILYTVNQCVEKMGRRVLPLTSKNSSSSSMSIRGWSRAC